MQLDCRVSVIMENELVREGMRRILTDKGLNICCAVRSPRDLPCASEKIPNEKPHVILCSTAGGSEMISTIIDVHERQPDAKIVALVEQFNLENLSAAFVQGVDGYVVNDIGVQPLMGVLQMVSAGEKVFPSEMAQMLTSPNWQLPDSDWNIDSDTNLSTREIEILRCLMEGDCNKVIARKLDITESTVKVHVKAVLRKLGVSNRTQAAVWAITRRVGQEEPAGPTAADLVPHAAAPVNKAVQLRVA